MPELKTKDVVSRLLRRRRPELSLCIGLAAVGQLADVPLALLVSGEVDRAVRAGTLAGPDLVMLGGMLGLVVLRWSARWAQHVVAEGVAQGVLSVLRLRMLAHLHRVRLSRLRRRNPGRTAARFAGDAASLRSWIATSIIQIPTDLLLLVVVTAVCAWLHPLIGLLLAVPLGICALILLVIDPRVRGLTRAARAEQARLTGDVVSSLQSAAQIRRSGRVVRTRRKAVGRLRTIGRACVSRAGWEAALRSSVPTAGSFSIVAVAAAGAWLLGTWSMSTGSLVAAVWLISLAGAPATRLAQAALMRGRADVARDRIEALFSLPTDRRGAGLGLGDSSSVRLRLNELSIRLPRGGRSAPMDATLRGPGLVAVMANRPALASLVNVLCRESAPVSGRIGLDRNRLTRYSRSAVRQAFWFVDSDGQAAMAFDGGAQAWDSSPPLCDDADRPGASDGGGRGAVAPGVRVRAGIAAGIERGARVIVIDPPDGLDPLSLEILLEWIEARSSERLWVVRTQARPGWQTLEIGSASDEPEPERMEPTGGPAGVVRMRAGC